MLLKNRLENLKLLAKKGNVLTKLEERYCYASDASNNLFERTPPDLVVFVETIEEVRNIVRFANANNIPIISRGAGTNMVGACICSKGGIILNFSKMNKIIEISAENMTVKVQPGTVLGTIKELVENIGLFFPPDPSNYKVSTIGGAIAQSSGGALAFKYGTIKDYILSLKVVTADGRLLVLGADTIKDSSGYHLNQLMIGSEGTLGIIVEATLKLIPKPESKKTIVAYFADIDNSIEAVNRILTNNVYPAAIEFMDKNSINTVEDYTKCGLNKNAACLLLIELDGEIHSVVNESQKACKIIEQCASIDACVLDGKVAERVWDARCSSFAAASRLAPDVISDDIIVPRKHLAEIIKKCNSICEKHGLKVCLVGHVGDGNIHPQIVLNMENEVEYRSYCNAKAEIYKLVQEMGGTISAEHGIGIEKLPYLEKIINKDTLEYMKLIKHLFDPKNILNPGKIFKL